MSGYGIFSQYYDSLMDNVDYKKRAEYFRTLLMRYGIKDGAEIVDLGCGTGKLTLELAEMGYDMTGVDISPDMLCEARNNAADKDIDVLLLCQSMDELDLYGTVDAAISTFDSINHLESAESVKETFKKVGLFMNPGGIFIFDINTLYKHRNILGNNTFVYDTDDVFCVWQNFLNDDDSVDISLDFFERDEDDMYMRTCESFKERAYDTAQIEKWLNDAELEIIEITDDISGNEPGDTTERLLIAAKYRGKKEQNG